MDAECSELLSSILSCHRFFRFSASFDGKTLIHPRQIPAANSSFAPSAAEIEEANEILDACGVSADEGDIEARGVKVVNGKLIESMHILEAQRIVRLDKAISRLTAAHSKTTI